MPSSDNGLYYIPGHGQRHALYSKATPFPRAGTGLGMTGLYSSPWEHKLRHLKGSEINMTARGRFISCMEAAADEPGDDRGAGVALESAWRWVTGERRLWPAAKKVSQTDVNTVHDMTAAQ